ncbi:MAG: hypothetical protein ACOYVF_03745 [Candidatus Zixiibacteriota bacterium]
MKTLKFQSESPAFAAARRCEGLPAAFTLTAESSRAGIESLLIGLCLRDWLTDSEKNFLDFLAPRNTLFFVLSEGQFLHPENTELFPLELIETAVKEGGEAFFSHRLQTSGSHTNQYYRVHTAHIPMNLQPSLILGMLCPDHPATEFEYTNSFCDLAIAFRESSESIVGLTTDLKARYQSSTPTLLINRSSGRLLAANPAATELFELSQRQLADMEYSRFKHRLADMMAGYKIKMDNIPQGENSLTIMTFTSEKPIAQKDDPFLLDHFLDSMMNKISSTTTAASYLGTLTDDGRKTEETELIEMILHEINEMEGNLSRFYTLTNCRHMPPQTVNLRVELEQAIEKVKTRYDAGLSVTITDNAGVNDHRAPSRAFQCLFEAVLLAHQAESAPGGTVSVRLESSNDNNLTAFFISGANENKPKTANRHWLQYSRLLAKNLGLNLNHSVQEDNLKIITEINISKQDGEK